MSISTVLFLILLSIGTFQGIFYGFMLLLHPGEEKKASTWLAWILFALCYRLLKEILIPFGIGKYDIWYHWFLDINWLYGPLIFFYIRSHTHPERSFLKKDYLHFIPFALQLLISNFVRAQNFYWDGTKESISWLGYWGYMVWMNYPTQYAVASGLILVYTFRAEALLHVLPQNTRLSPEKASWISHMIRIFRVYFGLFLLIMLIDFFRFDILSDPFYFYFESFYYYPFFLGVALLVYWMGFRGFEQKEVKSLEIKQELTLDEQKSLEKLARQLKILMQEEGVYKDPELNLPKLAAHLQVKPYRLSKCLKWIIQMKFHDFINTYRVEEVQRLVREDTRAQFTLLGLAYEAGFNSKSSFDRAIKKHLGISPKDLKN